MGYYYWDPTYILVVIGAVICMIASARVKGTFNKYSQLRSMSGMNGAQVAQRVLQAAGIYDCLLYTSPSPRDRQKSRMPSSA